MLYTFLPNYFVQFINYYYIGVPKSYNDQLIKVINHVHACMHAFDLSIITQPQGVLCT